MRGIMGLQRGGQVYPAQSDSARAEFDYREDMKDPNRTTRMLMEMAGYEFPEPTRREEWEREMKWLDYLDRLRASDSMIPGYDEGGVLETQEARTPRRREDSYRIDFLKDIFDSAKEEDSLLKKLYMYGMGGIGGTTLAGADAIVDMIPGSSRGIMFNPFTGPDALSDREYKDLIMSMLAKKAQRWRGRASGGIIPGYQEGGPTPSAVQTYDYGVPVQTEQQWADLTDRVVDEGSREYTPYEGQRLAGFTPQEIAAQQATEAYSTGQGPQGTIDAQTSLQTAGQQQSAEGSLDPYMSQYTQNVTDPQLRQLAQFNQQQMQNIGSQAAGSGAFGGYRQGVMQQQQAMDTSQQAADIIGTGQQKAFESAQQALQADRQAALGAGQAQTTLGGQQQAQQRQRLGDLGMVGQQRRDLQQKSLDIGYQDFQNRLDQERKNIDWQTQAMSKMPYKGGVTQTTYGEQPTDWAKTTTDVTGADTTQNIPGQRHGGIVGPMYSQFLRGMRR